MLQAFVKENYTEYVNIMYKRKSYFKIIIKQKLNDLFGNMKVRIINKTNDILVQFNKTQSRKSFFSYLFIFRYTLNKIKLYNYVDRFKLLKR